MDNIKDDAYYIKKILTDIKYLISKTEGISLEELKGDETLCDSVLFRLIQISENTKRLTDKLKSEHKEIFWQAIVGMRNRIVHEYGDVEFDIVHDTVTKDIPMLCKMLEQIQL